MSLIQMDIVKSLSSYAGYIEKHLSEGDWEGLNITLQKRQEVLEAFFSQPNEGKEPKVADLILKIQAEDIMFLKLLKDQKLELEKQFTSLKQGRKLVKVYQDL